MFILQFIVKYDSFILQIKVIFVPLVKFRKDE